MADYLPLGSTPLDEYCTQVGDINYALTAKIKCELYLTFTILYTEDSLN